MWCELGRLDSRVVFALNFWTWLCFNLGREVGLWWRLFFFGSSITSTLNFQRRRSEWSRKTIINTIICLEIVEICVVYESVLKIMTIENKIIFLNVLWIKHKRSSWILTSQTGGQPYSDTSPYKVSEYSLDVYRYAVAPFDKFASIKSTLNAYLSNGD